MVRMGLEADWKGSFVDCIDGVQKPGTVPGFGGVTTGKEN